MSRQNNMKKEFGGGSSSRSKSDQKRSGGEPVAKTLNAMSPYHSGEDLSLLDEHDDGTAQVIEDLDSRVAATREEARATIMLHLERNIIDSVLLRHGGSVALKGTQWLSSTKASVQEKINGVRMACAAVLCLADDTPSMYDEFGAALMSWLSHASAAQQPAPLITAVMESVALLLAANGGTIVGERSLEEVIVPDVEWSRFEKNAEAYGAILTALASSCPVTQRSRVKALIEKALDRAHNSTNSNSVSAAASLGLGALEAASILQTRFHGTFTWEEVEAKLPNSADKAVAVALRDVQLFLAPPPQRDAVDDAAALEGDVASVTTPTSSSNAVSGPTSPNRRHPAVPLGAPFEHIHFRERSVEIIGFHKVYLLRCLRSLVGEGLLSHLAKNATVRRMFQVTDDLVTKMTKQEIAQEKEEARARHEEKVEMDKERDKDRRRKHTERLGFGDDE